MADERITLDQEFEPSPQYWYEPTRVPSGGDWPLEIKADWVGIRLPVKDEGSILSPRDSRLDDPYGLVALTRDGFVRIGINEAVSALRLASRTEAADFWVSAAKVQGWSDDNVLFFRLNEGNLLDAETGEAVEIPAIPYSEAELEAPEGQLDPDIE